MLPFQALITSSHKLLLGSCSPATPSSPALQIAANPRCHPPNDQGIAMHGKLHTCSQFPPHSGKMNVSTHLLASCSSGSPDPQLALITDIVQDAMLNINNKCNLNICYRVLRNEMKGKINEVIRTII